MPLSARIASSCEMGSITSASAGMLALIDEARQLRAPLVPARSAIIREWIVRSARLEVLDGEERECKTRLENEMTSKKPPRLAKSVITLFRSLTDEGFERLGREIELEMARRTGRNIAERAEWAATWNALLKQSREDK
jgi:hypothetical protein